MRKWLAAGALVVGVAACAFAVGYGAAKSRAPARTRPGYVRLVVLFWFKEGSTPQDIKNVENAFRALRSNTPLIESLEWGRNISPLPDPGPCSHCLVVTFKDIKDHEQFLVHPAYREIHKMASREIGLLEFDYVVQKPPTDSQ